MNTEFEKICKMSQQQLKEYVVEKLKNTHKRIVSEDGFVYAEGTFPVLLVAHLDTVHKILPTTILYDLQKNTASSPNGIGGDDRCGVYMILEIVKKHNCSVVFCEDEEIGCVGARKFIQTETAKNVECNYIIEFDRKGKKDAVFYNCDNDEFEDFITAEYYETSYGSFSDISIIAPFIGCAAVNLSCGYYNPHTEKEYVALKEMEKSIKMACMILDRTTEEDVFEYIEAKNSYVGRYNGYNNSGYSGSEYDYEDWYGESDYSTYGYYIIEYVDAYGQQQWFDTFADTKEEAIGRLLMEKQYMCYADIVDICVDYLSCT